MEKLSQNKRGRPKGESRLYADKVDKALRTEGCTRTKVNAGYALIFFSALSSIDAGARFQDVMGCTQKDTQNGKAGYPTGYRTAAQAAGRYIADTDDQAGAVQVFANARVNGFSYADIAAHFRKLRIGEKDGNALSLYMALNRTIERYRRTFPKTTEQQIRGALNSLVQELEG